jgi:hypothetical protein
MANILTLERLAQLRLERQRKEEEQQALMARVRARHPPPHYTSPQWQAQQQPPAQAQRRHEGGWGGDAPESGDGGSEDRGGRGGGARGGGKGLEMSKALSGTSMDRALSATSWPSPAPRSPGGPARGGALGGVFTRLARLLPARDAAGVGWGRGGWKWGRKGGECFATPRQSAAGETSRGSRGGGGRGRGAGRGSRATQAQGAKPGRAAVGGGYLYLAGGKFGDPEDDELEGGKYPSVRTMRLSLERLSLDPPARGSDDKPQWEVRYPECEARWHSSHAHRLRRRIHACHSSHAHRLSL